MTEGLLFDSQYIIYVLGGTPSESDLEMLKRIEKLGISAIFIRTHIDLVKKGEEDVYKAIDEEQKIIVDTLGHPIIYIPLCNDETSSSYNEWSEQYDQFVSILTETINDDIEEVYLDRIIRRLKLIQQDFVKVLEAKRELLVSSNGKNVSEIEEQIKKIDSSRATLKRQLDAKLEELNRESTHVEKRISRIIDASKNQAYANFCSQVCSMSKESFLDEVNSYYKKVLPEEIQRMSEETGEEIQKWTSGCVDNIQQKLQQLSSELSVIDVSFQSDFCLDIAREYAEKEQLLAEDIGMKLCQLEELNSKSEEELNSLGIERKQIETTLESYRSAIAEGESGLNAIRQAYEPQYIIKGGKLGGIMKHVGDVADIAMLLIPVAGWECAGAKLAAGAGKLSKGGKVAKQAAKALDLMSKGAKAMAEADKVLDASKIVKGGLQAIQQGN